MKQKRIKMRHLLNTEKAKIRNIVITVLVIVCIYLFIKPVKKPDVIIPLNYADWKTEVELLTDSLGKLNDSLLYSKEAIKQNNYTIDSLYIVKRLDSVRISKMGTNGKLKYFKDYIDNVAPIVISRDSVLINAGYITGASYIFLDHKLKVSELRLMDMNIDYMETIQSVCVEASNISNHISDIQLTVKSFEVSELEALNKQYKRQIRKQRLVGIGGVALLIVILL